MQQHIACSSCPQWQLAWASLLAFILERLHQQTAPPKTLGTSSMRGPAWAFRAQVQHLHADDIEHTYLDTFLK